VEDDQMNRLKRFLIYCCLSFWIAFGFNSLALTQSLEQAQTLNETGRQQFEQGQLEKALELWQSAEQQYRDRKDTLGTLGTQLNQVKALQALGFYRRAQKLSEQITITLEQQPDSSLKANASLTFGNTLRLIGQLDPAQKALEDSLAIALRIQSPADIQAALLHLGNLAIAQQNSESAIAFYQRAATYEGGLKQAAKLQQAKILLQTNPAEAVTLLQTLQTQLESSPATQQTIFERIELANILAPTQAVPAARLLAITIQDAKQLNHQRAESYATGTLGHLYEQKHQWQEAQRLTQSALLLAQRLNVPEIAYQWQWQLGRIQKAQGNSERAAIAYSDALMSLNSLRSDLVGINQDIQFSFREQVEPVYREYVDLLLSQSASQDKLIKARQAIDALQLAELNNFFREACLNVAAKPVESIDQTAAVIYPIILRDRLEVILSIPGQPLRYYTTMRSQQDLEADINAMRQSLRRTSFDAERNAIAEKLYSWIVQPALTDLTQHRIQTLAFVLDGSLRNLPMAALYDGKHYLIEQYRIAITPGLQLFSPQKSAKSPQLLIGGLSEAVQGQEALPGVKQEVAQLQQLFNSKVLLNQQFQTRTFRKTARVAPFSVLHLATHGQFSSKPSETFLLTWDGRMNLDQLRTLLSDRELERSTSIDLLVLSACQTAKGDRRAALGLAGIAVRSGAKSTLATLWTVNDASTALFMTTFYRSLLNTSSKAEAVRRAQLELLQNPEFRHPYHWAPFILVGNWL
jgi:CHAT domain-containing protein